MEVMLALAIVASVVAAVYASFRAVTVAWRSTDREGELSELGRGVLRLVGDELGEGLVRGAGGVGEFRFLGVDGGERKDASDRLSFVFLAEPWTLQGYRPLMRVYYYVDESLDGDRRLVRMERPAWVEGEAGAEGGADSLLLDVEAFGKPESRFVPTDTEDAWVEVLADDVVGARFSYFDGGEWKTAWDSDSSLPEAVAVSVGLRDGAKGAVREEEYFTVVRLWGRGDLHVREGGGAGLPGGGAGSAVEGGEEPESPEVPSDVELPPPPPGERDRGAVRGR